MIENSIITTYIKKVNLYSFYQYGLLNLPIKIQKLPIDARSKENCLKS